MKQSGNENGRILILVLVIIATLSAFWFIALGATGTELQLTGGRKSLTQQFFDAEASVAAVMEDFTTYNSASLSTDPTTQVVRQIKDPTSAVNPADQKVVAEITCRAIHNEFAAAGLPFQAHEMVPPPGSGSGVSTAVSRRYAINAVSGKRELQVGVYWTVPK